MLNMNESQFVETLESFYRSKQDKEKVFRIGNISSTYSSGLPKVLLDGDDGVGDVVYPHLFSYAPSANDRVLLIRFGTTYLILGKINNDGSPSGGGGVGGTSVDWGNVTGKPSTFTPSAHTHSWSDVTGKPSTFTPSTHTHAISDVASLQTELDGKSPISHTHSWTSITSKPTTFTPEVHSHSWAEITGKPSTFAPTAHSHVIADVTGLQTALDGKSPTTHTHDWASVTGKPSTFTPSTHTHTVSQVTDFPSQTGNSGKMLTTNGTALSWVTPPSGGGGGAVDWADILNKPSTFAPSTHTHAISDVTNLQTTLDGKSATTHTHDWASITGKPTTFTPATHSHTWTEITGKPTTFTPSAHSHAISDVTGLQTALDGKPNTDGLIQGALTHTAGYMYIKRYNDTTTHASFAKQARIYYSGGTATNQLLFQVIKNDDSVTYAKLVALSFDPSSSEKYKKDIEEYKDSAMSQIMASKAYKYRFTEADDGKDRLGLVIERETPEVVVNVGSDTIDLYGFATLLMKGIQEQQETIQKLEERIKKLEGGD